MDDYSFINEIPQLELDDELIKCINEIPTKNDTVCNVNLFRTYNDMLKELRTEINKIITNINNTNEKIKNEDIKTDSQLPSYILFFEFYQGIQKYINILKTQREDKDINQIYTCILKYCKDKVNKRLEKYQKYIKQLDNYLKTVQDQIPIDDKIQEYHFKLIVACVKVISILFNNEIEYQKKVIEQQEKKEKKEKKEIQQEKQEKKEQEKQEKQEKKEQDKKDYCIKNEFIKLCDKSKECVDENNDNLYYPFTLSVPQLKNKYKDKQIKAICKKINKDRKKYQFEKPTKDKTNEKIEKITKDLEENKQKFAEVIKELNEKQKQIFKSKLIDIIKKTTNKDEEQIKNKLTNITQEEIDKLDLNNKDSITEFIKKLEENRNDRSIIQRIINLLDSMTPSTIHDFAAGGNKKKTNKRKHKKNQTKKNRKMRF